MRGGSIFGYGYKAGKNVAFASGAKCRPSVSCLTVTGAESQLAQRRCASLSRSQNESKAAKKMPFFKRFER
jgi:hypothetical protein